MSPAAPALQVTPAVNYYYLTFVMTPRSKAGPALSNDPQSGELSEGPHPQDKKCGSCQDRARKVAWHLARLDGHR